jgi:Uma2 family endonuclease
MVDMQVVALPKLVPVTLADYSGEKFSDAAYLAFCRANPDLRIERTAEGEILIVPPAGSESSYRNSEVTAQLRQWAQEDGRGKAFDSSGQFMLDDGSALSPDAAWVSNISLRSVPREKRKEFLHLCPEFVVELMSPSDRLKQAKAKMEQWIANGTQLAWLIDGDAQTVYVYRKHHPVKTHRGIAKLAGDGPVEGFVLQLATIWKGLA